jgi:hypothetical protein
MLNNTLPSSVMIIGEEATQKIDENKKKNLEIKFINDMALNEFSLSDDEKVKIIDICG